MNQKLFFTAYSDEDFEIKLDKYFAKYFNNGLLKLNPNTIREEEELLSRKDVAKIYGVSFVTLRDWEINGIIPKPIRKGSRVYWLKSEIMNDMKSKKQ